MFQALRVLVVGAVMATALTACQPSGDPRCDRHAGILLEIDSHGWSTDCTPGFPNRGTNDGETWFTIWAWADGGSRTVWLWPDAIPSAAHLRKTLWHELAHVRGIHSEHDADLYSWCREPITGVGYSTGTAWPPSDADCRRVGAR